MGLHDRIKASIDAATRDASNSNTRDNPSNNAPAQRDSSQPQKGARPAPASRSSKPASKKGRKPGSTGLPPFKEPSIPKGHRALLVACSKTGRASWAVLKKDGTSSNYTFVRNLRAAPDPKAMKSKAPSKQAAPPEEDPSHGSGDIPMGKLDLDGFSCGVCGADGSNGSLIVRCGSCATLQCRPGPEWHCPSCGSYIDKIDRTMDSVSSTEGIHDSRTSRGGLPSGPTRDAITSAAPARTEAKSDRRRGGKRRK